MKTIHLKNGEGTQCGFCPSGTTVSEILMDVNCWDCMKAYLPEFQFNDSTEISKLYKKIYINVIHKSNVVGYDVVGSLMYHKTASFMPIVLNVFVKPEYRNKGIATIMMKRIMHLAGPPIHLKSDPFTNDDNPIGLKDNDLKKFYEKLGFVDLQKNKMMLWYPEIERDKNIIINIKCENYWCSASIDNYPKISEYGEGMFETIGKIIYNNQDIFKITIKE